MHGILLGMKENFHPQYNIFRLFDKPANGGIPYPWQQPEES